MQIADCQTYVKSLHQMHLHNPCLVLVPETSLSTSDGALAPAGKRSSSTSLLVQYVIEEFPGIQVEPVGRRYWNDTAGGLYISAKKPSYVNCWLGLEFIMQLCVEDEERAGMILAVSNK